MRDKILTELFKSKEFNDCISKMRPEHLQDDLKGEVMLILCEMEEGKLMDLHYKGVLRYYTVRVIINMIQSNTSAFYRKYRRTSVDLNSLLIDPGCIQDLQREIMDSGDSFMINHSKTLNAFLEHTSDNTSYQLDDRQLKEGLALDEIDNLYWYDKEIVKLYLELGTYRAVEAETGIPFESIYKTVQKSCNQIKKKVA